MTAKTTAKTSGESAVENLAQASAPKEAKVPEVVAKHSEAVASIHGETGKNVAEHKTGLLTAALVAGLLNSGSPAAAPESPYEPLAANGTAELVLKEDPAKNPELLALLSKFKKTGALEKLPGLSVAQRERVMGYYKFARTKDEMGDRAVASGVSGVILGFAEIADVRGFVEEYKKTGKAPKNVPLPYANFKGASEKFAGAANYLAPELESSKQLDDQVNVLLKAIAAEISKQTAEISKQIESLDRILKLMK